jgi:hypothetical protein
MMPTLPISLLSIAAAVSILFGVRYCLAREFMPYHATVAGRSWSELEPGVRTIILGMLRIVGGGFVSYGVALLWLLVPLNRGESWAPWAALTITLTALAPVLYVTVWLRRVEPTARTPIVPAAAVLVLAVVGATSSLFLQAAARQP